MGLDFRELIRWVEVFRRERSIKGSAASNFAQLFAITLLTPKYYPDITSKSFIDKNLDTWQLAVGLHAEIDHCTHTVTFSLFFLTSQVLSWEMNLGHFCLLKGWKLSLTWMKFYVVFQLHWSLNFWSSRCSKNVLLPELGGHREAVSLGERCPFAAQHEDAGRCGHPRTVGLPSCGGEPKVFRLNAAFPTNLPFIFLYLHVRGIREVLGRQLSMLLYANVFFADFKRCTIVECFCENGEILIGCPLQLSPRIRNKLKIKYCSPSPLTLALKVKYGH